MKRALVIYKDICLYRSATVYVSGPSARFEEQVFHDAGIKLSVLYSKLKFYKQPWEKYNKNLV